MIHLDGISKAFGAHVALKELTLTISPGTAVIITGPSGSGKTTLLRLISGLEAPDRGTITIDGSVVSRAGLMAPPSSRNLGFLFQTPSLWPHMNVRNNIVFGMKGNKGQKEERCKELLSALGLSGYDEHYPDELSGGEAQRVAIARTIAARPRHLLLDEPLSHLDDALREQVFSMAFNAHKEGGGVMIYVTHLPDEGKNVWDQRICLLPGGKFQAKGDKL